MTNVDSQLREDDTKYARKLMKKITIMLQYMVLCYLDVKRLVKKYIFKNKIILQKLNLKRSSMVLKKVFINKSVIPKQNNVLLCQFFLGSNST